MNAYHKLVEQGRATGVAFDGKGVVTLYNGQRVVAQAIGPVNRQCWLPNPETMARACAMVQPAQAKVIPIQLRLWQEVAA